MRSEPETLGAPIFPLDVRVLTLVNTLRFKCFCGTADRAPLPPREDVPLPTQPPYTAFVGNLAFDMSDMELEEFFAPHKVGFLFLWGRRYSFLVADRLGENYQR
jgi:hypothetical protein